MKLNLIGIIVGTHGIKGELKVKSDSSFNRFGSGSNLILKKNNEIIEITINTHRKHKDYDLITFDGLTNINDVLKYLGYEVYIDVEGLDELNENEFYFDDLIGLDAYNVSGELIGTVIDINEVPQGVLLEIRKIDKTVTLIPFVDEFIKKVNIDDRKIIISPIEGLL